MAHVGYLAIVQALTSLASDRVARYDFPNANSGEMTPSTAPLLRGTGSSGGRSGEVPVAGRTGAGGRADGRMQEDGRGKG